jgi:hypothetical protein
MNSRLTIPIYTHHFVHPIPSLRQVSGTITHMISEPALGSTTSLMQYGMGHWNGNKAGRLLVLHGRIPKQYSMYSKSIVMLEECPH